MWVFGTSFRANTINFAIIITVEKRAGGYIKNIIPIFIKVKIFLC